MRSMAGLILAAVMVTSDAEMRKSFVHAFDSLDQFITILLSRIDEHFMNLKEESVVVLACSDCMVGDQSEEGGMK